MIIKNCNGTSKLKNCKCGTWLNHHKIGSRKDIKRCSNIDCENKGKKVKLVGGHVRIGDSRETYIIPICHLCNKIFSSKSYKIRSNITPVIANRSKTCDRKNWGKNKSIEDDTLVEKDGSCIIS